MDNNRYTSKLGGSAVESQVDQMVAMYRRGSLLREIAAMFGVTQGTVRYHLRKRKVYQERNCGGPGSPRQPELTDYYLDILGWGLPPFEISIRDERCSPTSISVLASWGLIHPTDGRVKGHILYETSPAGIEALKAAGRSVESLERESAGG